MRSIVAFTLALVGIAQASASQRTDNIIIQGVCEKKFLNN